MRSAFTWGGDAPWPQWFAQAVREGKADRHPRLTNCALVYTTDGAVTVKPGDTISREDDGISVASRSNG